MTWINIKNRYPPSTGIYPVIVFDEGKAEMGFFNPIPPSSSIKYLNYRTFLSLEQNFTDRCVYVKYKAFDDGHGFEVKNVTYWYELDEMPEDDK